MLKLANSMSILLALVTFLICTINEISLFTSIIRMSVVFIGVMLAFYLAGQLYRFGVIIFKPIKGSNDV